MVRNCVHSKLLQPFSSLFTPFYHFLFIFSLLSVTTKRAWIKVFKWQPFCSPLVHFIEIFVASNLIIQHTHKWHVGQKFKSSSCSITCSADHMHKFRFLSPVPNALLHLLDHLTHFKISSSWIVKNFKKSYHYISYHILFVFFKLFYVSII